MSGLLPLSENESAHDGDENEEGSELKGIDERGEKHQGDAGRAGESVGIRGIWNRAGVMNHGGGKQSGERKSQRKAAEFGKL